MVSYSGPLMTSPACLPVRTSVRLQQAMTHRGQAKDLTLHFASRASPLSSCSQSSRDPRDQYRVGKAPAWLVNLTISGVPYFR